MTLRNLFTTIGITLMLAACNTSSHENDAAQKAQKQLADELPSFLQLTQFDVLAAENYGDEVDPQIKGRFKASVQLIEPLYSADGRVGSKAVLSQTVAGNQPIGINGKYTAWLQNGLWRANLDYQTQFVGSPLANWAVGTAVIKDSDEYNTLLKNQEQAELEAIRKHEERNRLEAQEREKTAKLEEKLRQERAEREAIARKKREAEQTAEAQRKAEAEKKRQAEKEARRLQAEKEQQAAEALAQKEKEAKAAEIEAKKVALREKLVGTWVASSNIIDSNGASFNQKNNSCEPSGSVRFDISIPDSDLNIIDSDITLYMTDDPSSNIKLKTSVEIADDGTNAQLSMPANVKLKCKKYRNSSLRVVLNTGGSFPWIGEVGKQWELWEVDKEEKTGWHIVLRKQKTKK